MHLGWPENERLKQQVVTLDIDIEFSQSPKACETDQLEDTINYQLVCASIRKLFVSGTYCLLERCADLIATHLLTNFAVERVIVHVAKSGVIKNVAETAVEIERKR